MSEPPKIVIDTNVVVSALRSKRGWSHYLLSTIGTGLFEHVVTVPLVMEYEDVLLRPGMVPLSAAAVLDVVDYLCATGKHQEVHFLWRPLLPDAKDDMVLEAAVNGSCAFVVTHNVRDFIGSQNLNVSVATPGEFMGQLLRKST